MGLYINNKIIQKKEEKKHNEMTKSHIMLQLAEKEARLKEVEEQNAMLILEIANMRKGI